MRVPDDVVLLWTDDKWGFSFYYSEPCSRHVRLAGVTFAGSRLRTNETVPVVPVFTITYVHIIIYRAPSILLNILVV